MQLFLLMRMKYEFPVFYRLQMKFSISCVLISANLYNNLNSDKSIQNLILKVYSHLQEQKTFYGIRNLKNTGNMENIRTCIIRAKLIRTYVAGPNCMIVTRI